MAETHDDEHALLDAYARATAPTTSEVERALTRMLARIENAEPSGSLPRPRRRFVWMTAAAVATLVIASAAFAGVRWYQAQPRAEPHGAVRLERTEVVDARAATLAPAALEPTPAPAQAEPEPVPGLVESSNFEPSASPPEQSSSRREKRRDTRAAPPDEPPALDEASLLAKESELLALVREAIRDNDFDGALARAREHAREYPHGVLTEERLILEAVAACRGGQRERGLAVAKQLREQFPNTSALTKVEQACADP